MTTTDLILPETLRADVAYAPGGVDGILERIEREVRAVPTDISTKPGRQAVAALAYRVARSKTALDELGKNLVADIKGRAALIDDDRRRVRERLDALRDEVRRPLTDWEDAERRRVEGHERALAEMAALASFSTAEPTVDEINRRISLLECEETPRQWHEFAKRAGDVRGATARSLEATRDAAIRRDAERAELERLRSEAAERAQRERDDQLRAEAAERARLAAEAEARETARVLAAREAAERARIDRERLAAEEARQKAERNAQLVAEKAEQDRIAAEEKAEQDRVAAVEAERRRAADEAAAARAEQERREADERHRDAVHMEIEMYLADEGLSTKQSHLAVKILAAGKVPHVRIVY